MKKIFIKLVKLLGFEIIDQNKFYSPTLNKELNEDLKKDLTVSSQKQVSGRFDMETGKGYINDQEVSTDEYVNFANLSQREKINQYGQTPITTKSNDYSCLDTYTDYEEDSGSTTYVVTQKSKPTTNTGTNQEGGVEQAQLASLSLHSSNESGSNWSDELQKR